MNQNFLGGINWRRALETEPEKAYFAYQNQWGSPNQQKFYQNQFSQIQDKYLGRVGRQIMGGDPLLGGVPTLTFPEFLKNYDWQQGYAGLTPSQRGVNKSQFAPAARWGW